MTASTGQGEAAGLTLATATAEHRATTAGPHDPNGGEPR